MISAKAVLLVHINAKTSPSFSSDFGLTTPGCHMCMPAETKHFFGPNDLMRGRFPCKENQCWCIKLNVIFSYNLKFKTYFLKNVTVFNESEINPLLKKGKPASTTGGHWYLHRNVKFDHHYETFDDTRNRVGLWPVIFHIES